MKNFSFGDLPDCLQHKIHIDLNTGCWLWSGAKTNGYGMAGIPHTRITKLTHRIVYELLIGPIPIELEIDHLCRRPACCNPDHLELVTHQINVSRGGNAIKTHCKHGHEFTPENIYRPPKRPDQRNCYTCIQVRNASRGRTLKSFQ